MKNSCFLCFSLLLLLTAVSPGPGFSQSKWNAVSKTYLQDMSAGQRLKILAEVSDPGIEDFFLEKDISVSTKAGNIWSLSLPFSSVRWLEEKEEIKRLELSYCSLPQQKQDSVSQRFSLVQHVQSEPAPGISSPYTGKGIIVGIIDIGFQPDHPTFFDTSGKILRVKRLWNQSGNSGNPPAGFSYGTLYSDSASIVGFVDSSDLHGSHVAGIAAGSGFGSENRRYAGVAYDAELAFVNILYSNQDFAPSAKGDLYVANAAIIDGLDYIFRYADSAGKPAVVNLSWGMHSGPHDGSSLFDLAIDHLTGPGKIFVGSAGNEGSSLIHISHVFEEADTVSTFPYVSSRRNKEKEDMLFDLWGSENSAFSISLGLADSSGNVLALSDFYASSRDSLVRGFVSVDGDSLLFLLSCVASYPGNGSPNMLVELVNQQPGKYWVILRIASPASSIVHGWNSGAAESWEGGGFLADPAGNPKGEKFIAGNSSFSVGENGGTGKRTVSVGAYAAIYSWKNISGDTVWSYHTPGQRGFFSSKGPTRDGRIKPDISAPGVQIVSAYNRHSFSPQQLYNTAGSYVFGSHLNYYGFASGTSMASPHVAGIIALMLQARSDLSPEDVLHIIHHSGMEEDEWTGALPNYSWGYGKINAYRAVLLAQAPLAGKETEKNVEFLVYPNPVRNGLKIVHSSPDARQISYVLRGSDGKIWSEGPYNGKEIDASFLPEGIYFLTLEADEKAKTVRVAVIR